MNIPVLHASDFRGREGQSYRVTSDSPGAELELTLTSVATWGPEAKEGERQPFTIVLGGPLEPVWPQYTYRVEHPDLGSADIFLVPLGPRQGRMRYEAVFA